MKDLFKVLVNLSFLLEISYAVHLDINTQRLISRDANLARPGRTIPTVSSWFKDTARPSLWSRRSPYRRTIIPGSYLDMRRRRLWQRRPGQNIVWRLNTNTAELLLPSRSSITVQSTPRSRSLLSKTGELGGINVVANPTVDAQAQGNVLENNPLMLLLNNRDRSKWSAEDEKVIGRHLVFMGAVRSNSKDANTALQRQLKYIESVSTTRIRRELLKLFVKDMVEKSGFLSEATDHRVIDIAELIALVDRISEIKRRFNPIDTGISITGGNNNAIDTTTVVINSSQTDRSLLTRAIVSSALNAYKQSPKQKQIPVDAAFQNELSSFRSRWNTLNRRHQSRNGARKTPAATERDRISTMVGKSIYGERVHPTTPTTTTPRPFTTEMNKREPVGGTGDYWAHLHSGLADLLCTLCKERKHQDCIIRYCNNDSALP